MTINNEERIIRLKKNKIIYAVISVILIGILVTPGLLGEFSPGFSVGYLAIVVGVIYLVYYLYVTILEPYYIYYNDEGTVILFRFFSAGLQDSKKRSIEIPKNEFVKFSIEKSTIFKKKEKIILYQKTRKGVAKYPPLSISFLTENEKGRIKQSLTQFSH